MGMRVSNAISWFLLDTNSFVVEFRSGKIREEIRLCTKTGHEAVDTSNAVSRLALQRLAHEVTNPFGTKL